MIKDENYDLRSYNLASYGRFFFGRTRELDNAINSIKFNKSYWKFVQKKLKQGSFETKYFSFLVLFKIC